MGGTSITIHGAFDDAKATGAETYDQSDGSRVIDVAPKMLTKSVLNAFSSFVNSNAVPLWPASKELMQYLTIGLTAGMRGESPSAHLPTTWQAYLLFSGCAGMSQTSSEVSEHWFRKWNAHRPNELPSIFQSFGFQVDSINMIHDPYTYLPTNNVGYASFFPGAQGSATEDDPWAGPFNVDQAYCDHLDDGGLSILQQLESAYRKTMNDGKCRCQLCCPEFVAAADAI